MDVKKAVAKELSRTTPTESYDVPGYHPTLQVYKYPASKYYQARVRIGRTDGKRERPRKSLKTKSLTEAKIMAGEWYTSLLLKKAQNLPLVEHRTPSISADNPESFAGVAKALIISEENRAKNGDISERINTDLQHLLKADLLPFFGAIPLMDIDYQKIEEYQLSLNWKFDPDTGEKVERGLGVSTVQLHFFHLRRILKHAYKLKLITEIPSFPTIGKKKGKRKIIGWFDKEEYAHLIKTIKGEIREKTVVRGVPLTEELLNLVNFEFYSFLRHPDIIHMKNNQISFAEEGGIKVLFIRADAKVDESEVVSMPECVEVYEALLKAHKAVGKGGPNDYAFFPEHFNSEYPEGKPRRREYAKATMRRQFDHILKKAKLKIADNGEVRTLYSLRHSRLMHTLKDNPMIDLKTLASNARTSVRMLDEVYLNRINNTLNIEKITGIKGSERLKKAKERTRKAEHLKNVLDKLLKDSQAS